MYRQLFSKIIIFCVVVFFVLFLTACKAVEKIIEIEKIKTEQVHDTIKHIDSVYIAHVERIKGDSFYFFDTIYKYKVIDKKIEVLLVDSIPYTIQVTKEVRKRNFYDKFTACGFWFFISILCIFFSYKIGRFFAKKMY